MRRCAASRARANELQTTSQAGSAAAGRAVFAVPAPLPAQQPPAGQACRAAPQACCRSPQAGRPASPTAQATLLGQFGDWGATPRRPAAARSASRSSKPTSSVDNPPNRRTAANAVYMFVSTAPAEKVKDEVSMLVTGYAFKPNTDASLAIGSCAVRHVHPERRRLGEERRRRGAAGRRHAQGRRRGDQGARPPRGTQTTDTFSLKGVAQALDRVAQECKYERA